MSRSPTRVPKATHPCLELPQFFRYLGNGSSPALPKPGNLQLKNRDFLSLPTHKKAESELDIKSLFKTNILMT